MLVSSLRAAITAAGGTPSSYSPSTLLRQYVTALGGTPIGYNVPSLLRQAITAAGYTPVGFNQTDLLRQLVTARGQTPASYSRKALQVQLAGGAPAPPPPPPPPPGGLTATPMPSGVSAAYQWHGHTSSMTNFSSAAAAEDDPVMAASDAGGVASITGLASSSAPLLRTDGLGRKFLRFRSSRHAVIDGTSSTGLRNMSSQAMAVFMVVRSHKARTTPFFYPRYQSDGTTANNSFLGSLRLSAPTGATGVAPSTGSNATTSSHTTVTGDRLKMNVGTNIAVIGMVSRTTAAGGTNLIYNGAIATTGAQVSARTGMIGAVLGASPGTGSAITLAQATTLATVSGFDLYELIVVNASMTDAQVAAMIAALKANWTDISEYTDQLLLEGDSITDGIVVRAASDRIGGVESDQNFGMTLTEPGAMLVPATCKVVPLGVSGGTVATLVTRRDGGGVSPFITPYDFKVAGNKVAVMIGRNDFAASITAADHYTNLKALLHTGTGTGYLERGFDVTVVVPITGSSSYDTWRRDVRDRIVGTGFAGIVTDMSALNAAYASRVTVLRSDLIQDGGATCYEDGTDAASLTYFQPSIGNVAVSDATHPNGSKTALLASGGDTPQHGYGAIL